MLENIANLIVKEVNHAFDGALKTLQRRILRTVLKAFFITAGIAAIILGLILMGAKYVGFDIMLLISGVVLVIAFFLS